METFEEDQDDILYAAALSSDYDQLMALVDRSKMGWNSSARSLIPAIAQSGTIELFDKVFRGSSLPADVRTLFYTNVIRFNKYELFLEFVFLLKPEIDGTDPTILQNICWTCCQHERQELVRVLIEHKLNSLLRIYLMESLVHVIKSGNIDIFTMLLGDSASPGLWKLSLRNHYRLLETASVHNRVDMVRFMLSLDGIDESFLVNAFSSAVVNSSIFHVYLTLGLSEISATLFVVILLNSFCANEMTEMSDLMDSVWG